MATKTAPQLRSAVRQALVADAPRKPGASSQRPAATFRNPSMGRVGKPGFRPALSTILSKSQTESATDLKIAMQRLRACAEVNDVKKNSASHVCGEGDDASELNDDTELHMLKVRMRLQDADLEQETVKAAAIAEQVAKFTSEIEQTTKHIKNLQAYEAHQEKKIQTYQKQTSDSRKMVQHLTNEIERIKAETLSTKKRNDDDLSRVNSETSSVVALSIENDKMKANIQELKDEGKSIQEKIGKQQSQLKDARRRHQQECKRFVNLIHKKKIVLDLLKKQRDHVENSRMHSFTAEEFRCVFQNPSG